MQCLFFIDKYANILLLFELLDIWKLDMFMYYLTYLQARNTYTMNEFLKWAQAKN